jgi:hypothetical protein
LKAAFALKMGSEELALFRAVAERDPPKKRVRELWVIAGRRAGKDIGVSRTIMAAPRVPYNAAPSVRRADDREQAIRRRQSRTDSIQYSQHQD